MNVGRTAVSTYHLAKLMNCGENGRSHPPLAKHDELWVERPFPPHHLAKLDERGENGRFHPTP